MAAILIDQIRYDNAQISIIPGMSEDIPTDFYSVVEFPVYNWGRANAVVLVDGQHYLAIIHKEPQFVGVAPDGRPIEVVEFGPTAQEVVERAAAEGCPMRLNAYGSPYAFNRVSVEKVREYFPAAYVSEWFPRN